MRKPLLLVSSLLLSPVWLQAQQPAQQQQTPGIVVVSSQKCNATALAEMRQWFRQSGAPVLDDLVRQGKLTGWGVLEHAWGDEWNSVFYYTARDLNAFTAAFAEYFQRISQREPNLMQRFDSWCSEHKDNIYNVVLTNAPLPQR